MPLQLARPVLPDEARILAKATARAAQALGLSQKQLAAAIGISTASVSRMKDGSFALPPKPFELAACLVRVFRSLDAILGGDRAAMQSWMRTENRDLGAAPRDLITTAPGLIEVMQYLDAARAPL